MIKGNGVEYIRLGAASKLTGIPLGTLRNAMDRKEIAARQYRASRKSKVLIWQLELQSVQEYAKGWPHRRPARAVYAKTQNEYPGWITIKVAMDKYGIPRETLGWSIRKRKIKAAMISGPIWVMEPASLEAFRAKYKGKVKK